MNMIITILLLFFIIGLIVTIHEFGHFITAKKNGVYVSEFSIGMGPKIWGFKRKNDDTDYNVRLFPIGGFVAMAAKEGEIDNKKLKKNQILENKKFSQKLLILSAGIIFNYLLAIVLLFLNGLIFGSPLNKPTISNIVDGGAAFESGLLEGDTVISVDGTHICTSSDLMIELLSKKPREKYEVVVKNNGETRNLTLIPDVVKDENDEENLSFGFAIESKKENGFFEAIKYSLSTTYYTTRTIFFTIVDMFRGQIKLNSLSGPVGMYTVVDQVKTVGIENMIYLIAYLSINVGFLNLVPISVFDGGRILIVLIEKIFNKKVNENVEGIISLIGFALLILLTVYVTFGDIVELIKG